MTTRGIEAQYEAYDEALTEINRICNKVAAAIEDEEITAAVAAMCTIIIDSVHQLDAAEEERIQFIQGAMMAAWKDYHTKPEGEELH